MALLEVGTVAPDFQGSSLTGGDFSLQALKGARGVVLTFSPDQINPAQISWVKNLYDKHKTDIEIVSVTRQVPSVTMAKAFLQQLGIKFPVVYDQKQDVFKLYGVDKPVVVYAITKEGLIASVQELEPKTFNATVVENAIAQAKNQDINKVLDQTT
jgi:peroxiredoxin